MEVIPLVISNSTDVRFLNLVLSTLVSIILVSSFSFLVVVQSITNLPSSDRPDYELIVSLVLTIASTPDFIEERFVHFLEHHLKKNPLHEIAGPLFECYGSGCETEELYLPMMIMMNPASDTCNEIVRTLGNRDPCVSRTIASNFLSSAMDSLFAREFAIVSVCDISG
jgi:hypothetical protein